MIHSAQITVLWSTGQHVRIHSAQITVLWSTGQHVRMHSAQITVLWSTACQDTLCPNYSSLEHSMSGYTLPKLQFSGAQHVGIHCPNYSSLKHSMSGYTTQITVLWSTGQHVRIHCPNYNSLEHLTARQDTLPKLQFSGALDSELHCHVQRFSFQIGGTSEHTQPLLYTTHRKIGMTLSSRV